MSKYKYVTGVQCPLCKEKLWSAYVHDFHYCGCGYCFVDGGRHYVRYGWGDVHKYSEPRVKPEIIKFRISLADWLASDRNDKKKQRDSFPY